MLNKLEKIIQNRLDALDSDVGFLVYNDGEVKEMVDYFILTFEDSYEVYLYIIDDGLPHRDIMVTGVNVDLETAKDIALSNLQRELNGNNYH